jgi:hypothetical protein
MLVSAAPPVTTVQQVTEGYLIEDSPQELLKQNENFTYNFFVFNLTNGMLKTNNGVACIHYIADIQGKLIFYSNVPYISTGYWSINIDGHNFTRTGYYYYGTKCNSSIYGGATTGTWKVTPNGDEITTGKSILDIGFIFFLLGFFVFFIFLFVKYENIALRVGMFGACYITLIIIFFTVWNISSNYITTATFLTAMFRWVFLILMILALPLLIFAFVYYLFSFRKVKELNRLMSKGFSWEDANRRVKNG